jgi:YfiH family protein
MLQVKRVSQVTFLHSEALDRIPRIVHAFSTRQGDRNDFLSAVGAPGWPVMKLKQVHSGIVCEMHDATAATDPVEGDASVTALAGVVLAIQTADCAPILLADSQSRAVAAIHAGWRGTAAHISEVTVRRLREKFDIDPKNLTAFIGPHIGVCCYEVGAEVVQAITEPGAFEHRAEWAKPHLNLAEANRQQLLNSGIPVEQVETSALCTYCRADLFHSYRREGSGSGRMLSVIGIAP